MSDRRTRVAFDVGPLAGPLTGVGVATAGMLDALTARSDGPDLVPYRVSWRADPEPGVRRLPLPAALAHRLWARSSHPRADRWLDGAQVVHGTNYTVPPARVPRVVSVYDTWFLRHRSSVHPDVARAGRVLQQAVRGGAVVHASSEATADSVRDLLGTGRVVTIPLGPPPPGPRPRRPAWAPDGSRMVAAVGTLERRKDLARLVRAVGRLDRDDVALVLAGADGDDRPAIDDAIARLPPAARDRVLLPGRIEPDEKAWLLAHAAVLAYPSLDEGFGFPLLEAFAAGVPVVASAVGSIPEVAGPAAVLVPVDDVDALAEGLAAVLDDEHRAAGLIEAGRGQLAAFDWATTAARLHDLYDALAMESGPS